MADPADLSDSARCHRVEFACHRGAAKHCTASTSNRYTIGGVLWTCIIAVVAILPWYLYGLGHGVGVRFLHAQCAWACGSRRWRSAFSIRTTETAQSPDLFLCARRLRVLDQYLYLSDHRRPSLLFSPLPWWLQTTAIVFSVAMLVPVLGGSANFLLTMRGRLRPNARAPTHRPSSSSA